MADEKLKDFLRAAYNLEEAARYVINGETFGRTELAAALTEFGIANEALTRRCAGNHWWLEEMTPWRRALDAALARQSRREIT